MKKEKLEFDMNQCVLNLVTGNNQDKAVTSGPFIKFPCAWLPDTVAFHLCLIISESWSWSVGSAEPWVAKINLFLGIVLGGMGGD